MDWMTTEVWYCEEYSTWVITPYDANGGIAGDSEYQYRKVDAVDSAQAYLDSGRCEVVLVYTKTGKQNRIEAA